MPPKKGVLLVSAVQALLSISHPPTSLQGAPRSQSRGENPSPSHQTTSPLLPSSLLPSTPHPPIHFPAYSFPSGSEVLPDSSSVSPQLDSWGDSCSTSLKASLSVCPHLPPLLTAFLIASPSRSLLFPCWLWAEGAGLRCGGCVPLPPPAAPPPPRPPSWWALLCQHRASCLSSQCMDSVAIRETFLVGGRRPSRLLVGQTDGRVVG